MSQMMKCGCAAQGVQTATKGVKHDPIPVCIIHNCTEVDDAPAPLAGRMARCTHYLGRTATTARHSRNECNYGQDNATVCTCQQPSSPNLPFFESRKDEPVDRFYCGCWGWD